MTQAATAYRLELPDGGVYAEAITRWWGSMSLGAWDPWWEWVRPKLIHMNHKFFSSVFLVLVFFFFGGGYVVFFCLVNVVNSKDTAASYRHREFIY